MSTTEASTFSSELVSPRYSIDTPTRPVQANIGCFKSFRMKDASALAGMFSSRLKKPVFTQKIKQRKSSLMADRYKSPAEKDKFVKNDD